MINIKRKFVIANFLEKTSIHGLSYLNCKRKRVKLIFILMISISILMVCTTTVYYLLKYFEYESYLIFEEKETNSFDTLPGILICSEDQLSLLKSIIELEPKFNQIFNFIDDKPLTNLIGLYNSIKKYKLQNLFIFVTAF
jgi:hypothetical protein